MSLFGGVISISGITFMMFMVFAIAAVGYAYAPRDAEGSYMPCFLVGEAIANAIAGDRLLPLFRFSHQAGHIMAAVHSSSAYDLIGRSFAAFHVSGGTTELTLVTPDAKKVFRIEKIGGTRDLHAGQLIDRIGVMMGLPFPAGKELDRLSLQYNGKIPNIKTSVDGLYFNLSGAENMASDLFKSSGNRTETAVFVLEFIACSLLCLTENLRILYPEIPIVYSGGVMSSEYIKKRLGFIHDSYFAAPEFSSDNAAGCALLCLEKWRRSPERGASV